MNKKKSYFHHLFFLLLVSFVFFSCKLTIEEKNKNTTRPTAKTVDNHIVINYTPSSTSTEYVNIYRRDITSFEETNYDEAEIENIGLILPDGYKYSFIDYLVVQSHEYQYQCRIYVNDEYFYSNWSEKIVAPDIAYSASDLLSYNTQGVSFDYDSTTYTIVINGTITDPDIRDFNLFSPVIVISDDSKTQTFLLEKGIADGTTISLRSILTNDFLDKDIVIKGITAQRFDYLEANDVSAYSAQEIMAFTKQFVIWTTLSEISMTIDGQATEENIVNIPSSAKDSGFDYSRKVSIF